MHDISATFALANVIIGGFKFFNKLVDCLFVISSEDVYINSTAVLFVINCMHI